MCLHGAVTAIFQSVKRAVFFCRRRNNMTSVDWAPLRGNEKRKIKRYRVLVAVDVATCISLRYISHVAPRDAAPHGRLAGD